MADNLTEKTAPDQASQGNGRSRWHVLGWVLLGGVIGAALVLAFVAYSQPGLLLEQMNLRYCG
jgi:hypothetical protein